MGYFAQHAMELLDGDRTVLQSLEDQFPQAGQAPLRALAGCFGFSGDEIEKKCRVLSGGEKARLVMAKMLFDPPNNQYIYLVLHYILKRLAGGFTFDCTLDRTLTQRHAAANHFRHQPFVNQISAASSSPGFPVLGSRLDASGLGGPLLPPIQATRRAHWRGQRASCLQQ